MFPIIFEFVALKPRLARTLGEALCWVGSTCLLAGFLAYSINRILDVSTSMGGQATSFTYAQLLRPLPTWWVPESFLSVLFCVTLTALGYLLLETSRRLRRFLA
jgi:hypothetical protein